MANDTHAKAFDKFKFKPVINEVVSSLGFTKPTACQNETIPVWQKSQKNILCQAWTGSGKTHAFLLPIMNELDTSLNKTQAVIIVPTKELGTQIKTNLKPFTSLMPDIVVGSTLTSNDVSKLTDEKNKNPHILIGTPDRLYQLLETGQIFFTLAKSIVIDECDMLFNKDFIDKLHDILVKMHNDVKIAIFSATISHNIRNWILKYIPNITFVNVNKTQVSNANIQHILIDTRHRDPLVCLEELLNFINPYFCIIFVNNKTLINEVYHKVRQLKKEVALLHGDLPTRNRLRLLKNIQNLQYQYIVASDIASRGLDIEGASHVISLNIPNNLEFYIHRAGRCGRKNYSGISYTFYKTEDLYKINELKRMGVDFNY